jgi:hypothetical protein
MMRLVVTGGMYVTGRADDGVHGREGHQGLFGREPAGEATETLLDDVVDLRELVESIEEDAHLLDGITPLLEVCHTLWEDYVELGSMVAGVHCLGVLDDADPDRSGRNVPTDYKFVHPFDRFTASSMRLICFSHAYRI